MKRLQFELSEKRIEELDSLVEQTGLKTRVQLINTAITLFEWAVREREAGRIIASMDEGQGRYKEIEMPGFPNLQGEKEGIQEILDQLESYLETSEQEEAFTTLANALERETQGTNSNHPERSIAERAAREEQNRGQRSKD
jgi:hypothetical protein